MGRTKKGNILNGWINLDKPAGLSSTQAIGKIRHILHPQKIGHAGTLDPLATGVLPIALGEATKTIPYCQDKIKRYSFCVLWGEQRSTDDAEGEIIETSDVRPSHKDIEQALERFIGHIEQIPPRYSAIKINGQRAYDLARKGHDTEMKPRQVYIESLGLISAEKGFARFECICGKGTYMRSLARDIALTLGTVGHITELRREAVGNLTARNTISLEKLEELSHSAPPAELLLPVETVLDDIPALALNQTEATRLKNGQKLSFISRPDVERLHQAGSDIKSTQDQTALAVLNGQPVAIATVTGVNIQPLRILNL